MRRFAGAVVVMLVLTACTEPALPDNAPSDTTEDALSADVLDPVRDELVASIVSMQATVVEAREHLVVASEADTTFAARRAAGDALALLLLGGADGVADGRSGGSSPGARPALFPAFTSDRGDTSPDDALTATLSLARDAGGTLGRNTVETLRDPIAGDVGAWERDAEGVVASARAAVSGPGGVEDLIPAVLELPGDGTRALAWTLLAVDAPDLDTVRAAADRAAAHLGVVLVGLSLLVEADDADRTGGDDEAGEDDGGTGGDDEAGEDPDGDGG